VIIPFPEPTAPRASQAEVFLGYLEYFRSVVVDRLDGLSDAELRTSRLPSGWASLELLKHLIHVERRWLVWGSRVSRCPTRGPMSELASESCCSACAKRRPSASEAER
jgi:hypothetical protein